MIVLPQVAGFELVLVRSSCNNDEVVLLSCQYPVPVLFPCLSLFKFRPVGTSISVAPELIPSLLPGKKTLTRLGPVLLVLMPRIPGISGSQPGGPGQVATAQAKYSLELGH